MWRDAALSDDQAIIRMCAALNEEDPGPEPVPPEHMARTLAMLRKEPWRGRAMALDVDGAARGYALLISFWSNELGGETCVIDELYVEPGHRGHGAATKLIESLASAAPAVALTLELRPENARAGGLYRRLGFSGENVVLKRRLAP